MLTAIIENRAIKDGLFPGPGGNSSTQDGGGKPKTDFMWQILEVLFKDDAYVTGLMATVKTGKQHSVWTNKIKNKLRS